MEPSQAGYPHVADDDGASNAVHTLVEEHPIALLGNSEVCNPLKQKEARHFEDAANEASQDMRSIPEESEESMEMGDQERLWALALRTLVNESSTLRNLTDMEYAQHPIVARGDSQKPSRESKALRHFAIPTKLLTPLIKVFITL